jgi:pilus assembly protein CpaB
MKLNSKKMLIVTGVLFIIAIIAISFVVQGLNKSKTAQVPEEVVDNQTVAITTQLQKVVVVKQDIAARSTLTAEMIDIQELPAEYIHPMAIIATEEAINKLTLIPLNAGEQLLSTKIADPDTDYLSYMLKEGYVAYTVPISELTTNAGMVRVGDKIHVLGEFGAAVAGEDLEHFVLTDLTILALGQNLGLNVSVSDGGFSTMTLELLPEQAQILAWAQSHGSLNYILTSVLSDEENTKMRTITGQDVLGEISTFKQLEFINTIKRELSVIQAATDIHDADPTAMDRLKTKIMDNDKEAYDEAFFDMLFTFDPDAENPNANNNANGSNNGTGSVNEPIIAIPPEN